MSGRVDHVAAALELLVRAGKQGEDSLGDSLRLEGLVHATLAVAEQQRIANKLHVALVDQLTQIALTLPVPGYPTDPSVRIRDYLSPGDWEGLGL